MTSSGRSLIKSDEEKWGRKRRKGGKSRRKEERATVSSLTSIWLRFYRPALGSILRRHVLYTSRHPSPVVAFAPTSLFLFLALSFCLFAASIQWLLCRTKITLVGYDQRVSEVLAPAWSVSELIATCEACNTWWCMNGCDVSSVWMIVAWDRANFDFVIQLVLAPSGYTGTFDVIFGGKFTECHRKDSLII